MAYPIYKGNPMAGMAGATDVDAAYALRMAEMLREQANQPLQGHMVGRTFVAPSWTQGLAKMLSAGLAAKKERDAMGSIKSERERKAQMLRDAIGGAYDTTEQKEPTYGVGSVSFPTQQEAEAQIASNQQFNETMPMVDPNKPLQPFSNPGALPMPTNIQQGEKVVGTSRQFNPQKLAEMLIASGEPEYLQQGLQMLVQSQPKEREGFTLGEGQVRYGPNGQIIAKGPDKQTKAQTMLGQDMREYLAVNGIDPESATPEQLRNAYTAVNQQKDTRAKASAPNITTKIETKLGEGVAAQVGPMLKDSYQKTSGTINVANSSRMILDAMEKGGVFTGPTASTRMKLYQFGQVIGLGGKSAAEKLERTRQVVRGLAEAAVEARKELAGQGQVTENEAKAVEKAMSGNIDDLTSGEIRLIAGLNIKREKLARERHNRMLKKTPQELQPYFELDPESQPSNNGGWSIKRK